jgi:hypothetical protein
MDGGPNKKKIWLPGGGDHFEIITPKPTIDPETWCKLASEQVKNAIFSSGAVEFGNEWWPPSYKVPKPQYIGFDFSSVPDFTSVAIPGGRAILRDLDLHLASLRRRRDAAFESGLHELQEAARRVTL